MIELTMTQQGRGPDLVFLHGWGMNATIWQPLVERLKDDFRVTCVDLPGHGESSYESAWQLDELIEALDKQLPQQFYLVGWSLGGMIALKFSVLFPQRVNKLIMLAASAKFTQEYNWGFAQEAGVLAAFKEAVSKSPKAALRRFLLLQTQGMQNTKTIDKQMKLFINSNPLPKAESLKCGLEMLATLDVRAELQQARLPMLVLLGEHDQLVPAAVAKGSQKLNQQLSVAVIKGAAHLPFVSHIDETLAQIRGFCSNE